MVLYRDLGFISQEQYEEVEKKCAGKGADLPQDCVDAMDKVNVLTFRSMSYLRHSTFTMLSNPAMKTTQELINFP